MCAWHGEGESNILKLKRTEEQHKVDQKKRRLTEISELQSKKKKISKTRFSEVRYGIITQVEISEK